MTKKGISKYLIVVLLIAAIASVFLYIRLQEAASLQRTEQDNQQSQGNDQIYSDYKILFSQVVNGSEDIYLTDTDGNITALTTSPASEFLPSWPHDHKRIAFVSTINDPKGEIYTMNLTSSNWQRLTNNSATDTMPVWSSNGTSIAFLSDRWANESSMDRRHFEIYVMNANGSGVRRLTTMQNGYVSENFPVRWYGDMIVFTFRNNTGETHAGMTDLSGNIQEVRFQNTTYPIYPPTYSPSNRIVALMEYQGSKNYADLYIKDLNSNSTHRLAQAINSASWSPEGGALLFVADTGSEELSVRDLYVIGVDGCCKKKLLSAQMHRLHMPSW